MTQEQLSRLSPDEKRVKIAQACGYTETAKSNSTYPRFYIPNSGRAKWVDFDNLPDYLNDLNAMHEAVASLTDHQRHAYAVILSGMLWLPAHQRGWDDWRDTIAVSEATASQRADAFLLTIEGDA